MDYLIIRKLENLQHGKQCRNMNDGAGWSANEEEFDRLLEAARNGSQESVGILLEWYCNYLSILASTQLDQRLRRRVSPSDLVQETLLAAHRDFNGFRGNSQRELLGWLRQILIHRLHHMVDEHVKAGKRDIRREVSLEEMTLALDRSAANYANLLQGRIGSPSGPVHAEERSARFGQRIVQAT